MSKKKLINIEDIPGILNKIKSDLIDMDLSFDTSMDELAERKYDIVEYINYVLNNLK